MGASPLVPRAIPPLATRCAHWITTHNGDTGHLRCQLLKGHDGAHQAEELMLGRRWRLQWEEVDGA